MSEITKERALPEPVSLTDAELDAVAAGHGQGRGPVVCTAIYPGSQGNSDRFKVVIPGANSPRCLPEEGPTDPV